MQNTRTLSTILASLGALTVIGCNNYLGDDASAIAGSARYRDAETNRDGSDRDPEGPPAQEATIEITVHGTGELPELDPQCALDPAGRFEAIYTGEAVLDADGVYVASLAAGAAQVQTPSGCELPELQVGLITDVVIRAELEANVPNCEGYCAASARSDAEAECGASADAAACRAEAEAELTATCAATCTSEARAIVAEVSLGANAVGELDADALYAAALGELHADLTFDHME